VELLPVRKRKTKIGAKFNQGVKHVLKKDAKYIVLLNSQCQVDKNWLNELVKVAEGDPLVGICGSKILSSADQETIYQTGYALNPWGDCWHLDFGKKDAPSSSPPQTKIAVSDLSLFVKTEVLKKIGYLDEHYLSYYRDIDFCLRCIKPGYKVVYVPSARIFYDLPRNLEVDTFSYERDKLRLIGKMFSIKRLPFILVTLLKRDFRFLFDCAKQYLYRPIWKIFWRYLCWFFSFPFLLAQKIKIVGKAAKEKVSDHDFYLLFARGHKFYFPQKISYSVNKGNDKSHPFPRILVGINDFYLQNGWSLPKWEGIFPVYRDFEKEAKCLLQAPRLTDLVLQLHYCLPDSISEVGLEIFCEGKKVAEVLLDTPGWRTYQLPVKNISRRKVELVFKLNKFLSPGLKVNEISLLPVSSPFLRKKV
jgi:GT2 family glycosyltransferase